MKTPKKVKEIFINEKIPKEQRKRVPILLYQEEIIALGNFKRANMEQKETKKKICIKIEEVRH